MVKKIVILCLSMVILSCSKDDSESTSLVENNQSFVLTMSNSSSGNELLEYKIENDGTLTYKKSISTMGIGSGGGLGNQGAVTLSTDKKFVFVVNAGDNSVSSFRISSTGTLVLVGKYSLVGIRPISVTQKGGVVYVLNSAGTMGATSIEGFTLSSTGVLTAITGSSVSLPNDVNPAQISFVYDNVLVISERATNKLTSYILNSSKIPVNPQSIISIATQPFGFAVGSNGRIFVTEASASSSLSSYFVSTTGTISNISSASNAQGGACWAVMNSTSTICYSTNAGSNTISSFNIGETGSITGNQIAANLGDGNGPLDAGITPDNKYVYVLAGTSDKILGYKVNGNLLTPISGTTMFVPGASLGLAIY